MKDSSLIFTAKPRRQRWPWLVVLAAAALLGCALPRLAAVIPAFWQRADTALAAHFVPGYEARLNELTAENAALHRRLARAQDQLAKADALHRWEEAPPPAGSWLAARVLWRTPKTAELAGTARVGATVCDARGRFAGRITACGTDRCTLTFAPVLSPAAAGFAGDCAGLLDKGWRLTGLPLPTTLEPGTPVTTPDGLWLGSLAERPAPAADGLTAEVVLTDTADLTATVFFVKK